MFGYQLERWEASVQDYEALIDQLPGDEEVGKSLSEAQQQLKKQRGEGSMDTKVGANFVPVTNKDQLKQFIMAPGKGHHSLFYQCHLRCVDRIVSSLIDSVENERNFASFVFWQGSLLH